MPLPKVFRIDSTIKEAEPLQEASDRPAFTTTIKGYTYTRYTSLALFVALGLVWFVRRPVAE